MKPPRHRLPARTAALLVALAWTCVSAADPLPSTTVPRDALADPVGQMVFFAVLEGCYRDGVTNQVVDQLLPENPDTGGVRLEAHFVYACPLCMPALEALRTYRHRQRFLNDKAGRDSFGKGLPAGLLARLADPRHGQRLGALQELIAGWVQRRLELMRLPADERIAWNAAIAVRAAEGQRLLKDYRSQPSGDGIGLGDLYRDWPEDGCAVCNGALQAAHGDAR
jgi:hypothetical protein